MKLYAPDLVRDYQQKRMDSVTQAIRNPLEICVWTEFYKLLEANAKRFSDDTARDTRDLMEFVQAVYTSVNQAPESNLLALIDDLKSKAPQFDIKRY